MRKVLISLAAAGTALAFATPAAAQVYPAPPPQGYGYPVPPPPYGQAYGYHSNFGHIRALQARIDSVQRRIERLDRRDRIRERTASRLRLEARSIERRLRIASRNGLNPYEANSIEQRVRRLEQHVQFASQGRWNHRIYGEYANWDDRRFDDDDHRGRGRGEGRDDRYDDDDRWDRD